MPSSSRSQQRLFGAVHACQKNGDCGSPKIKKIAGEISYDDADEFASTKHKGLPEKKEAEKDESYSPYSFRGWIQRRKVREAVLMQGQQSTMGSPPNNNMPDPNMTKVWDQLKRMKPNPINKEYQKAAASALSGIPVDANNKVMPTNQPTANQSGGQQPVNQIGLGVGG